MTSFTFLVASMLVIQVVESTTLVESTATEGKPAPRPVCNTTNWSADGVACLKKYEKEHACESCTMQQLPIWCAAEVENDQACVTKFQENCNLWQSQSGLPQEVLDKCACQRADEIFPTFPRPNATCVRMGSGCLIALDCKRADDNATFSGAGCFDQQTWPQARKRCSMAGTFEPSSTSGAAQPTSRGFVLAVAGALMIVALTPMF